MKKIRNLLLTGSLLAAVLALPACSDVKQELGVGRNSPDEFMVVQRAPLTLPPDYTLRPPGNPSDAQPAAVAASDAKTQLLGKTTPAAEGTGEKTLMAKLGTASANPDIRRTIDEENGYIALKSQPVADKLIFWNDNAPDAENAASSVVDPAKEAQRIKDNKAAGKPLSDGNVPTIEKKSGTLDKIF